MKSGFNKSFLLAGWILFVSSFSQGQAACNIEHLSSPVEGGVIAYDQAGTGAPILLLHGLFADKEQWTPLLCLLSEAGYRAIAPDLPGYGKSLEGYGLGVYALESERDLVLAFADRLGLSRFHLAGSSMGGAVAALMTSKMPYRVRTLAFIGSPQGVEAWSPAVQDAIREGVNPFIPVTDAELSLELSLLFVKPPSLPPERREQILAGYIQNNAHYVKVWNIVNLYDNVLTRDGGVKMPRTVPSFILWGMNDQIFSIKGASKLKRWLGRGELERLPAAGHLLLEENAEAAFARYQRFLLKHRP